MAKKYLSLVTKKGKEKILNATKTGKKVAIETLKIGDGNGSNYSVSEEQTDLKRVVYTTDVDKYEMDTLNPNTMMIETRIPSSAGPFYIREIGLYDTEGDLILISSYEETYKPVAVDGSTMELYIRIALVLSNMSAVEVKIDPSIVMATKADIDKIYTLIGDLGRGSSDYTNTESVINMLLDVKKKVDNIDLTDTKITCTSKDNQKLNEVIKDMLSKIESIPDYINSGLDFVAISYTGDNMRELLQSMAKKGEILPQDVKGNSDQRLYKYVVLNDAAKDNPYWWIEYVDKNGESKSIRYYLKDLKLIKDIKADVETNKNKISVLESENASLKSEVLELKKQLANNNEQFKKLNEILKSLVGGDH